MAPVALGVQVPEVKAVLHAEFDASDGSRDFPRHKCLATAGALMVEQDAVAGVHAVGLPVVFHDPKRIQLGHAIWAARVEGRGLRLRHFLYHAVQFGGAGLVEPHLLLHAEDANGF